MDWDGDGDTDLICGNSAGYIGFIENLSGPGVARPKWAEPKRLAAGGQTIRILAGPNGSIQGPIEEKWGYTTVSVADWNGDGLIDLVVNGKNAEVWIQVGLLLNRLSVRGGLLVTPEGIAYRAL